MFADPLDSAGKTLVKRSQRLPPQYVACQPVVCEQAIDLAVLRPFPIVLTLDSDLLSQEAPNPVRKIPNADFLAGSYVDCLADCTLGGRSKHETVNRIRNEIEVARWMQV